MNLHQHHRGKRLGYGRAKNPGERCRESEKLVGNGEGMAQNGHFPKNRVIQMGRTRQGSFRHCPVGTVEGKTCMAAIRLLVLGVVIVQPKKGGKRKIRGFGPVRIVVLQQDRQAQQFTQQVVTCGKLNNEQPNNDAFHAAKVQKIFDLWSI